MKILILAWAILLPLWKTSGAEISRVSFKSGSVEIVSGVSGITFRSLQTKSPTSNPQLPLRSDADFIEVYQHGRKTGFLCWGDPSLLESGLRSSFVQALTNAVSIWQERCVTTSGYLSPEAIVLREEYRNRPIHAAFHYRVETSRSTYRVPNHFDAIPKTLTLENIYRFFPDISRIRVTNATDRIEAASDWRKLPPGIYILHTTPVRIFWRAP